MGSQRLRKRSNNPVSLEARGLRRACFSRIIEPLTFSHSIRRVRRSTSLYPRFACVQLFILCSMIRLLSGELVDYSSPLRSLKCFLARGCLGSNFLHQSPSASLQDSLKCRHLLHHLSPIGTAVILRIKTRPSSMRAKNPCCLWVWV